MDCTLVFEEYEDTPFDCPPLTEEAVREAEHDLGVRLPQSLIRLLRVRNGGWSLASIPLPEGEVRRAYCAEWVGIMGIMGICSSTGIGKKINDLLRDNWHYPENTVVFSHGGHAGFALDYRKGGEPSVLYLYGELGTNLMVEVASTFDDFLDRLERIEEA